LSRLVSSLSPWIVMIHRERAYRPLLDGAASGCYRAPQRQCSSAARYNREAFLFRKFYILMIAYIYTQGRFMKVNLMNEKVIHSLNPIYLIFIRFILINRAYFLVVLYNLLLRIIPNYRFPVKSFFPNRNLE